MLAEMPSAPPILLLHVILLYTGGTLFVLGIGKTFKQLPGVIMSVIGALLIFMSFMCFNMECAQSSPSASSGFAEQNPKNPHPPTVEEMEPKTPSPEQIEEAARVQSALADKKPKQNQEDLSAEALAKEEDVVKTRKREKSQPGGIRHPDYTGVGGHGCHYKE